jgi:hypothetical protein
MEEKIREELYDKLESELASYKKELETLTAKEIIDKSYETAIKEESIYLFYPESKQFDIDEIKALKNEKNSLETLYQGWLDCDMNICELVEDSARDTVEELVQEFKEKQSKKKNKER